MRYLSTRGQDRLADFTDVLLSGLAHDGGLYVPEHWPAAPTRVAGRAYHEIAAETLAAFTGPAIGSDVLRALAEDAYAGFRHPAVMPLVQIAPGHFLLELFHGPTLAFKDVAMQVLARLMDHVLKQRGERITIVGATSGDTGGAAIEAFGGLDSADVVILYPRGRVSEVQRRQMTTVAAPNVHAVAVEGDFDACQALVKAMFNDRPFRERMRLSGVNSINWARIAAQSVYYVTASAALGGPDRPVAFSVPTGNFGDVFAGYVASRMGANIARLLVATNVNDILARTFATGRYESHETIATQSPSMDIQVSSNFERLLFEAHDRDAAAVAALMDRFARSGGFFIEEGPLDRMRGLFSARRTDEQDTTGTIRRVHRETGLLIDPHTAVAVAAAERETLPPEIPIITLSTAHPAKFPDAVEAATGVRPALPDHLADLFEREERTSLLPGDLTTVERFVEERCRPAGAAA